MESLGVDDKKTDGKEAINIKDEDEDKRSGKPDEKKDQ